MSTQATSTHKCSAMRSQLHGAAQWVGPDTAQRLTSRSAHLRSPTAPSSYRGAPGSSSRPKRLVTAREDRREDGLPTVEVAQVVEVVDLRVGDVPSSRPIGGGSCWSCRGGSALPGIADPCQLAAAAPISTASWRGAWRQGDRPSAYCKRPSSGCFPHFHRCERQGSGPPSLLRCPLGEKGSFPKGTLDRP